VNAPCRVTSRAICGEVWKSLFVHYRFGHDGTHRITGAEKQDIVALHCSPRWLTTSAPTAAILHEKIRESIYILQNCRIRNRATVFVRLNELCRCQHVEMKRKCRTRQLETTSNCSCRKAVRSVSNKQPKDVEPRLLGQCGERCDCVRCLHVSRTIEI